MGKNQSKVDEKNVFEPKKFDRWSQYMGEWYEIARTRSSSGQVECAAMKATYDLHDPSDQTFRVVNRCINENGITKETKEGTGIIVSPGRVVLSFNHWQQHVVDRLVLLGEGNYLIYDIDPNVEWVVVVNPSKEINAWILAKYPERFSQTEQYNTFMEAIEKGENPVFKGMIIRDISIYSRIRQPK
jgi:lipocalin